jgi:hypothetical protein
MARAGLSMGLRALEEAADVLQNDIARFEAGGELDEVTVETLQKALERAGAEFVADGANIGVWLRRGDRGAVIDGEELTAANDE